MFFLAVQAVLWRISPVNPRPLQTLLGQVAISLRRMVLHPRLRAQSKKRQTGTTAAANEQTKFQLRRQPQLQRRLAR